MVFYCVEAFFAKSSVQVIIISSSISNLSTAVKIRNFLAKRYSVLDQVSDINMQPRSYYMRLRNRNV